MASAALESEQLLSARLWYFDSELEGLGKITLAIFFWSSKFITREKSPRKTLPGKKSLGKIKSKSSSVQ